MKRLNKMRKEHGAITMMTAILLVVLLGFTALAVDYGVHYLSGAKLQNAVDAAATAAAASIGNVDQSIEDTAYEYLKLNGFDKDGKYKDKINLNIETKGVVDLETLDNDENYITAGFYKITCEVDETTLFAQVLGVDSMKVVKTSYVRCRPNYVDMPKALNYTIFAGSTNGTNNEPAVKVDGRTGATVNTIVNGFERLINWTNATIVQPIIGWFGGNPDYNELVHINLSEIVCNGDVHSNSNIRIGVQALNVSRVKDRDYEGISSGENNHSDASNSTTNVDSDEINGGHDYGQVTFTAVDDIKFTNSLKNSQNGRSTHVYVQNQQYLEQTQDLLDVLDEVDFTICTDTATLRAQFRHVLENEFDPEDPRFQKTFWGRHFDIYKDEERKQALKDQVDLIEFDPTSGNIYVDYDSSKGKALLLNQKQIVYNVSQNKAEEYLNEFRPKIQEFNALIEKEDKDNPLLNWRSLASGADNIDKVTKDGRDELRYANYADKSENFSYDVLFSRARKDATGAQVLDDEGYPLHDTLNLTVKGLAVSRNFTQLGDSADTNTVNGVKFAVVNTFQEDSDYIPMPNLKPYFTRQINNSVRNATKTKEESSSSTTGDRNIKQAVDTKGKEYQQILKDHKFKTSQQNENGSVSDAYTYEDKAYNSDEKLRNLKTTPLFTSTIDKSPTNGGQLTYLTGEQRTKFKGYNLYQNTGSSEDPNYTLKTPKTFVDEYLENSLEGNSQDMGNAGAGAINKFYNDVVSKQYFARDNSFNAVNKKKTDIESEQTTEKKSYNEKEKTVKKNIEDEEKPDIQDAGHGGNIEPVVFIGPNDTYNIPGHEPLPTYDSAATYISGFNPNGWNRWDFTYPKAGGTDDKLIRCEWGESPGSTNKTHNFHRIWHSNESKTKKYGGFLGMGQKDDTVSYASGDDHIKGTSYSGGRGFIVSAGTYLYLSDAMTTGSTSNNTSYELSVRGTLLVGGNVTVNDKTWIHDDAYFVSGGSVTCKTNEGRDGAFETGSNTFSVIQQNLTAPKLINGTGSKIVVHNNLTINGDLTNNGIIYVDGNLSVTGTIVNNGTIICKKDISCNRAVLSGTGITYCETGFSCTTETTLTGRHKLYCKDDISVGDMTLNNSFVHAQTSFSTTNSSDRSLSLTNASVLEAMGTFSVVDYYVSDNSFLNVKVNVSFSSGDDAKFRNQKGWVLSGNQSAKSVDLGNCEIRIDGDFTVTNGITLSNGTKLYVTGTVYCGGEINLTDGSGLYADRGVGVKTKDETAIASKTPTKINLSGASVLLCRNDINATTLKNFAISTLDAIAKWLNIYRANIYTSGVITAEGGSKVYAEGRISTNGAVAKGSSAVAGFYAVDLKSDSDDRTSPTKGMFTVDGSASIIFCGEKSTTGNKAAVNANGQFYYPTGTLNCNRLYVNKYGYVVIQGNATVIGSGSLTDWKNEDFRIVSGGYCYVKGMTTVQNCYINTNGKMYLVGGINYGSALKRLRKETNSSAFNKQHTSFCDAEFGTGSDSYIGHVQGEDAFTFASQYEARGNVYFESNLQVNGYIPTGDKEFDTTGARPDFPNRGLALYIPSGNTYVSGSVSACLDNAFYIKKNAGLIMKDDLTMGCAIYNYGKLIICNSFNLQSTTWSTDAEKSDKQNQGISLKNGENETNTDAVFYAYHANDKLNSSQNALRFDGYVRNYGKVYLNAPLSVQGWKAISDGGVTGIGANYGNDDYAYVAGGDYAYTNYAGAETHINGAVELNSNRIFNKWDATFACEGDFTYGALAVNCGKLLVMGDITNDESTRGKTTYKAVGKYTVNTPKYRNDTSHFVGYSFVNGLYQCYNDKGIIDADNFYRSNGYVIHGQHIMYPEATVFCTGNLKIGTKELANNGTGGDGGSVFSLGKMFIGKSLNIYTFDETKGGLFAGLTGTKNSHFYTALWLYNKSETFIGENNYNGAGVVIGNNSIYMCGGDYTACRSSKINAEVKFVQDSITVITDRNHANYTDNDLYQPAYVYIGGDGIFNTFGRTNWEMGSTIGTSNAPTNGTRDLDIYSNTNMYIGGFFYANCKVYVKQDVKLLVACKHSILDSSNEMKDKVFDAYTSGSLIERIKRLFLGSYEEMNAEKADYRFFVYQAYDQGVCSTVVALGNAIVQDTTKIRDMATTYFYGNFRSLNYFELGKALDDNDETEAKEPGFRSPRERTAIANTTDGEAKFLERYRFDNSANMYVGGDFQVGGKIYDLLGVLRISKRYIKIFASSQLRVLGNVDSSSYITLRHDARLIAKGNVKAETSVDVGSYSHVICSGSLKATTDTMKIRDQVTVAVGGDMIALGYVELGKAGDFVRTDTSLAHFGNEPTPQYTDSGEYWDAELDLDTGIANDANGSENTGGENAGTGEDSGNNSNTNPILDENGNPISGVTLNTETELSNDRSDPSLGGHFFVGGSLLSYTGYIKEFAYSFVSVGGVVFSPKYVTLRHNSDMWILPELYSLYGDKDNTTYVYEPYSGTSNGTLFGDIIYFIGKIAHDAYQNMIPHDGTLYTLGELTLNKNASLLGTYDAQILGQCVLREDSLVYLGHDFNCNAPSVNISLDLIRGNESVVGFDSYGTAGPGWKYTCKNYENHGGYYYNMTVRENDKPKSGYVKCDVCGNLIPASEAVKCQISYPAVVYAYNNINVDTTIQMRLTYLVANKGDVELHNIYTQTENAEKNAKELPNAIASYLGHINYFGMYSKLGALFYAPTASKSYNTNWFTGNQKKVDAITLDGYYNEIWGCILGDTIDMSSYYLKLHRFENWRTMDLHVVESGNVFIIPQKKYDDAAPNVDDIYLDERYRVQNTELESEGARQFFIPGEYIPHSVTSH